LTTVQKAKFSSSLHQHKFEARGTIPRFNPESRSWLPVSFSLEFEIFRGMATERKKKRKTVSVDSSAG